MKFQDLLLGTIWESRGGVETIYYLISEGIARSESVERCFDEPIDFFKIDITFD